MKFILKIIFTAATAYLMQLYFPWWSVVVASFLISMILSSNGVISFFSGFFGVGILWFILASRIDSGSNSILTDKVAEIFSLPNALSLILVASLVGAIAAGFGALAGGHLRSLIIKERKYKSKYS